ncbi:MAG: type VII secretion protein EssC [Lachnospiraceae bacterium]|nr:type VII secretion protein EssC [Lachnospiraceae bacterium]
MSNVQLNVSDAYKESIRYRRSPRLIKRTNAESIKFNSPPAKKRMQKGSIVQLIVPPLCMLAVTVCISIFMNRGSYVLMSASGTLMTVIISVVKFLSDQKECRESNKKREELYQKYLLKMRKEIYRRREQEIEADSYNFPDVDKIYGMVEQKSSRIYERNCNDEDFLQVVLGHNKKLVSFPIELDYDELSMDKDKLLIEANEIKDEAVVLPQKPVVADLKKAHLGLVGEKRNVHEQLKLLVSQLTFLQSYHDVEMIAIYDAKYDDDFRWMRWYPHFRLNDLNVSGCVNSEKMRDQVLGSLTQILKARKDKLDESKKESRFLPHYVFIIDEPKMIMDHSIMEYLDKDGDKLGFSIIYTSYFQADLPEYIGTVFMVENSTDGCLLLSNKEMVNEKLTLSHVGDVDLEKMARDLSVLKHEQGIMSQIPESITFFDMYQVERPEQLQVKQRWKKNESHKSLAVPLGVRAKEDYVYLNLHEKAHGPHGLVAGTTGSGKSEIVQSYILSLAVNFHPYEVGFLLIDYKGGGMANLFKDLPHLLGTITNLDGSESMRAMASIKSELARRQKIFSQYDVNHINAYNKLFKLGKAIEPIPHLFLISDEFAELKKEQPDFMSELVSAARIGRSLGIHLILATQKPSGVVDDQIWTNSKFKLALKVQNEGDSKEIIKTPDAAFITQAGRAYLQVGNNEIYELFQSAWSGAAFNADTEEEFVDDRVYLVNDLGQGELINQDLSKNTDGNQIKSTQLDVVVSHIHDIFEDEHVDKVKSPWLPSLERMLISSYIAEGYISDVNQKMEFDLKTTLGLVDIPEQQKQVEYKIDFPEDGNLAIYGSSGFGKTFTLSTMMMEMAIKNSAERVHYYILDFGNSGLIQFKNLPHTADYISLDDMKKLQKLIKILQEEIKMRKRLFADASAMNFTMYNQITVEKLPAIFLFIDNYDVIRELEVDLEAVLTQFTRDGVSLGIYVVITATRLGAVRYTVQNNFKNKIVLFMYESSDMQAAIGRTQYPLTEIKGRGLVKLENVNQIQLYAVADALDLVSYMETVRGYIQRLSDVYTGQRPKAIPMLPEELTIASFKAYYKIAPKHLVPIGLETEEVVPQYIELNTYRQLIIGSAQTGRTNMLKVLLHNISADIPIYLFDSKDSELMLYQAQENVTYINNKDAILSFDESIKKIMEDREEQYQMQRVSNPMLTPKAYYEQLSNIVVLVEDWDDLTEALEDIELAEAAETIMCLENYGITIIATATNGKLRGYGELTKYMKEAVNGVILGKSSDQSIFDVPYIRNEEVETGMGYIINKGKIIKIKIPLV